PPWQSAQVPSSALAVHTPSPTLFGLQVEQLELFWPPAPGSGGLSAKSTPENANKRQRTAMVVLRTGHLYQRSDGERRFHTHIFQGTVTALVCFARPCATSGPSWRCC